MDRALLRREGYATIRGVLPVAPPECLSQRREVLLPGVPRPTHVAVQRVSVLVIGEVLPAGGNVDLAVASDPGSPHFAHPLDDAAGVTGNLDCSAQSCTDMT